jgi:tryptophan-rich sensory protein
MSNSNQFFRNFIVFLLINFGGLALGGFFTGSGVESDWYNDLAKAPWTPPGWVFGFSWTTIMICFALFMAYLWPSANRNALAGLFALQWILNFSWSPIFFEFQQVLLGLIVISALTVLVAVMFNRYRAELGSKVYLIAPYLIWIVLATSLNAYILINN